MATSGVLMSGCPIFKWYTLFPLQFQSKELIYVLEIQACLYPCWYFGMIVIVELQICDFFELNKLSRLFIVKCGYSFVFSNFMETWSMKKRISFFFFIYALPFRHRVIFDSKEVNKNKIPLINNLVFIPINVNGVELTFFIGFWGKGNNSI
jgi:hypothetical protein